jgi:hypothetical protein
MIIKTKLLKRRNAGQKRMGWDAQTTSLIPSNL